MSLVSLNLKPSEKQLKDFGLAALVMFNVIGFVLLWFGKIPPTGCLAFAIAGVLTFLLGRISTKLIKPVYLTMIVLTFPIGWVISHLAMALFYYVIISGIGLFFRLIKRDPLGKKYDLHADTYWLPSKSNRSAKDYFHQF
jgi:hypothetical protein